MIVANNLKDEGSGFRTDTNMITLITKDDVVPLPLMSKFEAANAIIEAVLKSQR
jgi:phosphopantothenoylcysteine decarboxylase/phosphopantothenate--cysteine ligase